MKKHLLKSITSIFMLFMMSTTVVFANNTVEGNVTSIEFLEKSNEKGEITLDGDVTLADSLKIDGKNYTIDLNGKTLTFTKDTNLFTNNANVTFENGTLNLDGIKGNTDTILGVGDYGSSANLTLDAVKLEAKNYTSPYALIYVYNDSTLNVENDSVITAKNEKSLSGGVIKASKGQAGKINITNSTLNFENAARGFVDGTITIKGSTVNMTGLSNGINSSAKGLNLTVDNSKLTITGSIGRALTIDGTNVDVKNNSVINFSNSLVSDILFKSKGKIEIDKSSELNFKKVKLEEAVKGTELNNLIVSEKYNYESDDKGNVTITEKPLEGSMTSIEFLEKSNEKGEITLDGDVTLTDSLKIDSKNYTINLNGKTLTFTKDTNLFTNNANVTFENGTLNLDGIKGNTDTILGVGDYGSSANLTLDAVKLEAKNYTSPYALIYVYNDSTLNVENNSVITAKNERSLSGGVIKASKGQAGKINITNSTLNFENAARGFVDGTITIKGSTVNMTGLSNGINSSAKGLNLTVDNSKLTITGSIGRALTIDGTNVDVKNNSVINFSNSLVSDILFKSEGKIEIDKSSELNFKKVKLEEAVKGTELNDLIISEKYNYESDDKGNVTITEKPSEAPEETPGESPEQTPEQKPEESPEQTPEQKPSFDEIPESFIDFVTDGVFNIVPGTGDSTDTLVLEVVKGTEVEAFKSVIAKYSDYELTVTKKAKKQRIDTEVEAYILTFTKGEEEVKFEVLVPVSETKIIEYLDSSIEQQEQPDGDTPNTPEGTEPENKPSTPEGNEPSDKPQQPEEDIDQPVVAPDNSDKESETEQDKVEESDKPITGVATLNTLFTGLGFIVLGTLFNSLKSFKQKENN